MSATGSRGAGGGGGRDDAALVAAAQAGDRRAMEDLLEGHYDRIAAIARRMLRGQADAEDATQDALVAVVRGLPRFDGRSAVSTWIHRIAVNTCLDELRRSERRDRPVGDLPDDTGAGDGGPATSQGRPEAGPDAVADRVDIDHALAGLPPDFRAAVVLRDLCGLDYDEIASVLEVPPGTARSRISRGRRMLSSALGNPAGPLDVQGSG